MGIDNLTLVPACLPNQHYQPSDGTLIKAHLAIVAGAIVAIACEALLIGGITLLCFQYPPLTLLFPAAISIWLISAALESKNKLAHKIFLISDKILYELLLLPFRPADPLLTYGCVKLDIII